MRQIFWSLTDLSKPVASYCGWTMNDSTGEKVFYGNRGIKPKLPASDLPMVNYDYSFEVLEDTAGIKVLCVHSLMRVTLTMDDGSTYNSGDSEFDVVAENDIEVYMPIRTL